jgi:Holliday junction resolvasome RuvABC DNA-binding subunit
MSDGKITQKQKVPGVDVMITIFCDFSQFSAKKIGVFLKYQCNDQIILKFGFVLSQKRHFFRKIFRQKYFKNHNIGPRSLISME